MGKSATGYVVTEGDNSTAVLVEAAGADQAIVRVGDVRVELSRAALADGALRITANGSSRKVRVFRAGGRICLLAGGVQRAFDVIDERALWLGGGEGEGDGGGGRIVASMPGRVVTVKVQVGDEVAPGAVVAVLEAMKMENDVKTPTGGRVVEVAASAGDAVENGALLVRLEPPA